LGHTGKFQVTILAATALTAALVGGTTGSASASSNAGLPYLSHGFGTGATTLAVAEENAYLALTSDYRGCQPPYDYYEYGQESGGTWWADVEAGCEYITVPRDC